MKTLFTNPAALVLGSECSVLSLAWPYLHHPDLHHPAERANVFGPRQGYSPQIGTLVSEMSWMRGAVLSATKGMMPDQLDFFLDNKANRIGALLLHLAATEKLYQLNNFDNSGLG